MNFEYWLEATAIGAVIAGGLGLALTPFAILRGFRLLIQAVTLLIQALPRDREDV
jgi:hypothetical protein